MAVNLLTEEAFDEILASLEALKTQVENWEALAQKWAENPEDVEVATGQYSALHHALKAASHKIAAETAKTDAETALASVQQIFDDFDDRYLGSKTSDPATDNDGDALSPGLIYWNSTAEELRFYNGATWEAPSAQAATSAANALASENKAADWAEEDEDVEVETGQYSAKHHALKALASMQAAGTSETNAAASEQKAADWAEEDEDVEVETGQYSAKHWAKKSEAEATLSIQGIDFDAQVDAQVDLPAPPPEGDLAKYYIINSQEIAVYRASTSSWNIASLGSVTVEDNLTSSSTDAALSANQGKHLEDNKAERIEIAIPVDDMAALKALNPAIFTKALAGAFYSGQPYGHNVLWRWNAGRDKSDHDGWSCMNPDHLSTIGSSEWYSSTGDSTDDSGTGVWERDLPVNEIRVDEVGAVGDYDKQADTGTDDTTAIQTAINFASNNNVKDVRFSAKRYLFTNLYLHYDATNNAGFNSSTRSQGQVRLIGEGSVEISNLKNIGSIENEYRGTVIYSNSSLGIASILCDGSVTNQCKMTRIENLSIDVENTTEAVFFRDVVQYSGASNITLYQRGSGGGWRHRDLFNCHYDNIRIEGKGKATSLGKGFWIYNQSFGAGFVGLKNVNVNAFETSVVIGHDTSGSAALLHTVFGNIQGGEAVNGVIIGTLRSSELKVHTEQNEKGVTVQSGAREITLEITTSNNTVREIQVGTSDNQNAYQNITIQNSNLLSAGNITSGPAVYVYGGAACKNLSFVKCYIQGNGTNTGYDFEDVNHSGLEIIYPSYGSIGTEINHPEKLSRYVDDLTETWGTKELGSFSLPKFNFEQNSNTGGIPVARFFQSDSDEPFFQLEKRGLLSSNDHSLTTKDGDGSVVGPSAKNTQDGWLFKGMVRIEIKTDSGTEHVWLPMYDLDQI